MIHSGLRKTKHDWRDLDYFKTKRFGASPPSFKDEYNTDQKLWTPDQRIPCTNFIPNVPALPYGCTSYAQSDLIADEDGQLYNPLDLENITHANANGGTDLRTALAAVTTIHKDKHPTYFNVRTQGNLDAFDTVRLAMAVATDERRGVSVGTPWFPEMCTTDSFNRIYVQDYDTRRASWHNWAIKGWTTINGSPHLRCKPWLGSGYGQQGVAYMPREVFNRLMSISGTAAFTIDKLLPGESPQKIDSNAIQFIISLIRNALHL